MKSPSPLHLAARAGTLCAALLLACAGCSSAGQPPASDSSAHGDVATTATPSNSSEGAGDDSSQPKPGFCTDVINTPSDHLGEDDSVATNEETLKKVADYWHHTAEEAPAEVKDAALTVATGYDKLRAENATEVDNSSWQDALQTLVGYEITHCYG